MRVGTKGRFAVLAMVDLARHSDGQPVSLGAIADRQGISMSYLEQLFARLRKGGLVRSVRGPGGGYLMVRSIEALQISDIVLAVEEPSRPRQTGKLDDAAMTQHLADELWSELGQQVHRYLSSVTLADVVERRVLAGALSRPRSVESLSLVAAAE
jgi:Rrf2 family transcriptional regulator, iron-sulfur cluster assembly transcription factor